MCTTPTISNITTQLHLDQKNWLKCLLAIWLPCLDRVPSSSKRSGTPTTVFIQCAVAGSGVWTRLLASSAQCAACEDLKRGTWGNAHPLQEFRCRSLENSLRRFSQCRGWHSICFLRWFYPPRKDVIQKTFKVKVF